LQQGLFILLGSALSGCSSASNEMAGGNLQAVNHTVHGINWMSVNGYRADGGPPGVRIVVASPVFPKKA
ncbi:hypothetical protein CVE37_14640, partial [Pseudomonas syringae pv. actinidiae]|nr:hypothetical protein [Pseudomonas syringae pv. actinidiae]